MKIPDIVMLHAHRKELFGAAMSRWEQAILRGPSEWTVGERELLACLTAARLNCVF